MKTTRALLRKTSIILVVAFHLLGVSVVGLPIAAAAQEAPVATCPTVSGTLAPTGTAAHTFTFKPAGSPAPDCVWENAYYIWDPVTKVYTPKFDTYVCDSISGVCETVSWDFVTSDNQYVERRTVVYVPAPETTSEPSTSLSNDGPYGATSQTTDRSIVSGNGTDSNNTIGGTSGSNLDLNYDNDVSIFSLLNSYSTSGDATALFNTTVGDVSTGDSASIANILNMIQSGWDPINGNLTVFSADLLANYYGDLLFDPSIVLGNGTGSNNLITDDSDQNLTLNVSNNAGIQNDINLVAESGDATANGNTSVGNLSTGDADVVANLINMINSSIVSGDSFIGSLNLYGTLDGDILLPESLMQILLGNGTSSNNTITDSNTTDIDIDQDTTSTITNNTDLTANSGNAEANNNTTVGDVSTGTASTNLNEMNVVGQQIQGTSGLLVFVNVLGSWVGMLFNTMGNALISADNGTNSTNLIESTANTNADIDVTNNYGITNNLNLTANSGNATANANTDVGNVSTGDATASANILNMINSTLNFSDWFGVLFINVFGDWSGSFGVDTLAGDNAVGGLGGSPSPTAATTNNSNNVVNTYSGSNNGGGSYSGTEQISSADLGQESNTAKVLAASSSLGNGGPGSPTEIESTSSAGINSGSSNKSTLWYVGMTGIFSILLFGGDRLLLLIRKPQAL
jgi:hypothetical protein